MNFDEIFSRVGTGASKWDKMKDLYGIDPSGGIPMFVADMDFRCAPALNEEIARLTTINNYGYFTGMDAFGERVRWWMSNRHGWELDPEWVSLTAGLGNAIAICLQTFTKPGDGVVIFTPVYHEFSSKISRNGRKVVECPLKQENGVYKLDFDAYEAQMTGAEKMLIFCSPQNPAGRVWTKDELQQVAAFAERHDLLLVSDEIHHDLIYPGFKHIPFPVAAPRVAERLIMMTSASKTFNIAGMRTGCVTISNPDLRQRFRDALHRLDLQPNLFGFHVTQAAYSPEGANWVDELVTYLDGNRALFIEEINKVPGLNAMPMQSTYLAWVDFTNTGMEHAEIRRRLTEDAKIAASPGPAFGKGGENFMRFNIGTQRARLETALSRIQNAFSDLQ